MTKTLCSIGCTILVLFFVQLGAMAEDLLVIGMPVCLSGACAISGTNALHGAELAVKDLNQADGVMGKTVALKIEDSQDAVSGARAVTAYRVLRTDSSLHFFIGPSWTPGLLALAPIVSKEPASVMVSYDGGIRQFHEAGPNLFNIRGVDEQTTRELARFAFRSGARRAAIFGGAQAWELEQGNFFEDEFKKLGGTILIRLDPESSSSDLRDPALKIMARKPEAILFAAYLQIDLALKALQTLHYTGPKIISFIDNSRITLAGRAIEGAITFNNLNVSETFLKRVNQAYPGMEATWHAATAYDAVMLYAKAIKLAKTFEPVAVAKQMTTVSLEDGVSGSLEFSGGRLALRKGSGFKVVRNGTLVALEDKKAAPKL